MDATSRGEDLVLKCPKCGKEVRLDGPDLPFCSPRCMMIDLGKWLEEGFRINGEHGDDIKDRE